MRYNTAKLLAVYKSNSSVAAKGFVLRHAALLDLNAPIRANGNTLLHAYARDDNEEMVRFLLAAGADAFRKNSRGQMACEVAAGPGTRRLLLDAPMSAASASGGGSPAASFATINAPSDDGNDGAAFPHAEGYLCKWTNYATGYKRRWFVLHNGVLSYFKNEFECSTSCKGSIVLQFARILKERNDPLKFCVATATLKMHLRAASDEEAFNWLLAMQETKRMLQLRPANAPFSAKAALPAVEEPQRIAKSSPPKTNLIGSAEIVSPNSQLNASQQKQPSLLPEADSPADTEPVEATHAASLMEAAREALKRLSLFGDAAEVRRVFFAADEADAAEDAAVRVAAAVSDAASTLDASLEALGTLLCNSLAAAAAVGEAVCDPRLAFAATSDVESDEYFDIEEVLSDAGDALLSDDLPSQEEDEEKETSVTNIKTSTPADHVIKETFPVVTDLALCEVGYGETADAFPFRTSLPFKSTDVPKVGLWGFLRNVVGKDLSRLPLPVNYNEPLSMLQRTAEDLEYFSLLRQAASLEDPLHRLLLVAAFAVSTYASTDGRLTKPFNPLLGETFEFWHPQEKYFYLAEQVSHHPPISACHCESDEVLLWSEVNFRSKFKGKCLEVQPAGTTHLFFKRTKEHFVWRKANTVVNNILIGAMYIEHVGVMDIRNTSTGARCVLHLKSPKTAAVTAAKTAHGCRFGATRSIEGVAYDAANVECDRLDGCWKSFLASAHFGVLWEKAPIPAENSAFYRFSAFSMQLNALPAFLEARLPPTDARLRTDQRALENGLVRRANELKSALEAAQRSRRKAGSDVRPRWFRLAETAAAATSGSSAVEERSWVYAGGYWEARSTGNWGDAARIFDFSQ